MKEDILEQIVDEYLMHQGYFTMHNVKFKPAPDDPDYQSRTDSVASDIDVIAYHPRRDGPDRVIVVSCKSWQAGFDARATLDRIEKDKWSGGREEWKKYRELCKPKWSRAFMAAVEQVTGTRNFTYWTAVTNLTAPADRPLWEQNAVFRQAIEGNPIELVSFADMLDGVWAELSRTPAATELGRMIQLMKASKWLERQVSARTKPAT